MRYQYPERIGRNTLSAGVELDPELRVVAEFFGLRRRPVR
jgi:hypothetical protein